MILDTLPEVQSLSMDEKTVLANELLDELNAPPVCASQEGAILDVLNERYEAYREGNNSGANWAEVRARLQEKTGASWRR